MSRTFTNVDVYMDFDEKSRVNSLTISGLQRIAYLSRKKVNGNSDDNDVTFHFMAYPITDKDKPKGMDTMSWQISNIMAIRNMLKATFKKGVDEKIAGMSNNELADFIRKNDPHGSEISNEKLFEMITAMKERRNIPRTHVIFVISKDSPSYMQLYACMVNPNARETIRKIHEDGAEYPTVCITEENPNDYTPEDYLGGTKAVVKMVDKNNQERSI